MAAGKKSKVNLPRPEGRGFRVARTVKKPAVKPALLCRVCGGAAWARYAVVVLGSKKATLGECKACGSLSAVDPTWLDEAYALPQTEAMDSNAPWRHACIDAVVSCLVDGEAVPRTARVLDFGSGTGGVARLLRTKGHTVVECGRETIGTWLDEGPYDLALVVEVLEHLTDPAADLTKIAKTLRPTGLALASTCLYDGKKHDADWAYLALEWGQHITWLSQRGLGVVAKKAGLRLVTTLTNSDLDLQMHLFALAGRKFQVPETWFKL